jgi:transposase-like protein
MLMTDDFPDTLVEFDDRFSTEEACREYLMRVRWPQGWRCPNCGHTQAWLTARALLHCAACDHQASLTAGTVLHSTKKPLRLWFKAMFLMTTQKNGISAKTLQQHLGLSAPTAWTWVHKLRDLMLSEAPISGTIEVDETYLGTEESRSRGRHKGTRSLVVIAVEDQGRRAGQVRMTSVPDASAESLQGVIQAQVASGTRVHTDGWNAYTGRSQQGYAHEVDILSTETTRADRAAKLDRVFPHVHRVASLLQRWWLGTHQGAVRGKHLQSYLNEFGFRFNRRRHHRPELFEDLAQRGMVHKARPYWRIIGRVAPDQPLPIGHT